MLTLMKNEMVLLEEGLSALGANVRTKCAASVGMAFIVKHKAVLGHKALSAELAKVRFGLLLRRRRNLNDGGLLDLLLLLLGLLRLMLHLNSLLLHEVLLHLSLLMRLSLYLYLLMLLCRV
jgi:hypothetical protein